MTDPSYRRSTDRFRRNLNLVKNGRRRTTLKVIGLASISGLLGTLTLGATRNAVATNKKILSHTISGNGPIKLIVLHDWSVSVESDYHMVQPFFNPEQFTIAYADVRGYGGSIELKGEYTAAEISSDVQALADSLNWQSFSILGHSMTGMAVQRIMVDIPDRLVSVVATTPIPASGFPVDDETFGFFESMATNDDNFKGGMHSLTSQRYGDAWVDYKLRENRKTVLPAAMKAYTTMWSKTDFSAEAKGNQTSILVVYGQHDNEALRQTATGPVFKSWYSNLEEYSCQSGHYPMIESPVEYANIVSAYLIKKNGLV